MTQVGFYPDPPSRRMAYDQDGTIVIWTYPLNGQVYELSLSNRQTMNNEGNDFWHADESGPAGVATTYLTFIFPEKRNITHYYAAVQPKRLGAALSAQSVEWSNDTTNAIDGTWNVAANSWQPNSNTGGQFPSTPPGLPACRTLLETLPIDGVKAVRFRMANGGHWLSGTSFYSFHLWGHKTAGETPHRIDFAYADGSELLQDFDYGDQPRGTARTWGPIDGFNVGSGLYLRNRSPDKAANDVVVTLQNLSGDMINRLTLSKDNISYGTQLTWTAIQPLEIVGPVYVRHTALDTTPMGLYLSRLKLVVGAWV